MRKILAETLLCLLAVMVSACDSGAKFDEFENVGENGWARLDTVKFQLKQPDSLKTYNLFINLRASERYPYRNIFLITAMNFPHGKVVKDTLEYNMARPDGKLMGADQGSLTASKLWYKQGVVFPEEGNYEFSIRHATRKNGQIKPDDTLPGIVDVGFRVEEINQKQ